MILFKKKKKTKALCGHYSYLTNKEEVDALGQFNILLRAVQPIGVEQSHLSRWGVTLWL